MRVAVKDGESLRCKILVVGIHACTEGGLRTTMNSDGEWVTHSFPRSDGAYDPTFDFIAVGTLVTNAFRFAPGKFG
jgi:hypothetical protein